MSVELPAHRDVQTTQCSSPTDGLVLQYWALNSKNLAAERQECSQSLQLLAVLSTGLVFTARLSIASNRWKLVFNQQSLNWW